MHVRTYICRYTGGWFSSLNLIPLTNAYAKMFWKIIRGPEVRSNSLYFGIISTDPKSVLFQKMLRKKCENMVCVCVNLIFVRLFEFFFVFGGRGCNLQ